MIVLQEMLMPFVTELPRHSAQEFETLKEDLEKGGVVPNEMRQQIKQRV